MFRAVSPKLNIVLMEEAVLRFWKSHDVFQKSMDNRMGGPEFVFYEGPPTANGKPGVHHVLARAFKDLFPRFRTMRGYHVSRRGGWDTHGLPVEIEVEKKLGFTNKQQIEAFGIDPFNKLCRESAFAYIQEWERMTERIAYWADMSTAYVTFTDDYIESIWWILKNFWDKDLLYRGFKVVPYCPRCGTPLSDHEVAQGYDEAEDPSVFVRLPLVDSPDTSLLIWTTTPWTLPANVAVAAGANLDYVKVERPLQEGGVERLILAEALLDKVFDGEPVKVVERFKGKSLKGRRYQPLYTFVPSDRPAHYVVMGDFVSTEDGSGLVHLAPAFGADDMQAANEFDLPVVMTVAEDGSFIAAVRPWAGMFVKDADPLITRDLDARGLLYKAGRYVHTYPFCWRCKTPLLYYARQTWYVRTSQYKDKLVELNEKINWYPGHIKNGRFGNWLENNVDWALGRERYWGTPLPVWECTQCNHQVCVGSLQELANLAGRDLTGLELHRPYVDQVKGICPECKSEMLRVPELIDVWFDSGSMPVAQWHYPFENQDAFQQQFPADYICEAVDQTRGWFYSLHAISTLLFGQECFRNVICLGLILDGDGQKMSKSKGNVIDPWDTLNEYGADAMRWYLYTATPPGQERRFSKELVSEVVRNFTLTLWNTYSFFVTYANLDGWKPDLTSEIQYSPMDRWLRSALNTLVRDVTEAYETYDVLGATRPIEVFVDQLSNWYLRRSRRRFWKTESDDDKQAAYATLYEALTTLSKLLAPSMPFLAEELHQNLVRSFAEEPLSVHVADWTQFDPMLIDEKLNRAMALVMRLASLGHAARNKANRKVRQPLQEVAFSVGSAEERQIVTEYAEVLAEELNVKKVRVLDATGEAVAYSLLPLPKQLGQKYGSKFPAIRQALMENDAESAAALFLNGESVNISLPTGEQFTILPEEIEVRIQAREGYAVASEGSYLAALVTDLTPELVQEGLAREFVRRVQDLRKQADLQISDRIQVFYAATPMLAEAVDHYQDYIMSETLAVDLLPAVLPEDAIQIKDEFDGERVSVGLIKAGL